MIYKETHLKASDAISFFMKSCEAWGDGNYIFRGHSNSNNELMPSAWRNNEKTKWIFSQCKNKILSKFDKKHEIIESYLHKNIQEITTNPIFVAKLKEYVWQVTCELYLVHEFTHRSNLVGLEINTPSPFGRIADFRDIISIQDRILFGEGFGGILQPFNRKESSIKKIKEALEDPDFNFQTYGEYNFFLKRVYPHLR